jgi:hypothetical protein
MSSSSVEAPGASQASASLSSISVEGRISHILDGLSRRERRLGDDTLSVLVKDRFCIGWSESAKRQAAFALVRMAKAQIQARRSAKPSIPAKLL